MIYVIGTGPSALAATLTLIKKNLKVIVIDVAKEPEKKTQLLKKKLKKDEIFDGIKKIYKNEIKTGGSGFHKSIFGSNFFYEKDHPFTKNQKKTYVSLSNAYGGFSNSWGGVCLPMFKDDFKNWPISQKELIKYYKSVSETLNLKSDDDDFNNLLNLHNYQNFDFDVNFQGKYILNNLKRYKSLLNKENIYFSRAKLALKNNCKKCGYCMHGCPYNLIFNSKDMFEKLADCKKIDLLKNTELKKFYYKRNKLCIEIYNKNKNSTNILNPKKLLIACGTIGTLQILNNSLNLNNQILKIKNKDVFFVPLFLRKKFNLKLTQAYNTMCQVIIKNFSKKNPYYLQIFPFSDVFLKDILNKFPNFSFIFKIKIFDFIFKRLMLTQLILPSKYSDDIICSIKNKRIFFKKQSTKLNPEYLIKILKKIKKIEKYSGFHFINFLKRKIITGGSYHIGSVIPMVKKPKHLECNVNGNLYFKNKMIKNIYFVDSSVLPDLPSSPITFTSMANSMRIADKIKLKK